MSNEMTKAMLQGLTDAQLNEMAVFILAEQYRREKQTLNTCSHESIMGSEYCLKCGVAF
jgi:hypothetical protein